MSEVDIEVFCNHCADRGAVEELKKLKEENEDLKNQLLETQEQLDKDTNIFGDQW